MPVVAALRNPNVQPYHMDEIKAVIGRPFEIDDSFTLQDLMNLNVVAVQKDIIEISTQATAEAIL